MLQPSRAAILLHLTATPAASSQPRARARRRSAIRRLVTQLFKSWSQLSDKNNSNFQHRRIFPIEVKFWLLRARLIYCLEICGFRYCLLVEKISKMLINQSIELLVVWTVSLMKLGISCFEKKCWIVDQSLPTVVNKTRCQGASISCPRASPTSATECAYGGHAWSSSGTVKL